VELEHPTLQKVRSIANPIRYQQQAIQYRLPPPLLGEHSRQVLAELGYSAAETENQHREK
jgi:crotonobetainyl-CoA:carnitine CoA-transferase CaiB-like acyl-CoA transferase